MCVSCIGKGNTGFAVSVFQLFSNLWKLVFWVSLISSTVDSEGNFVIAVYFPSCFYALLFEREEVGKEGKEKRKKDVSNCHYIYIYIYIYIFSREMLKLYRRNFFNIWKKEYRILRILSFNKTVLNLKLIFLDQGFKHQWFVLL